MRNKSLIFITGFSRDSDIFNYMKADSVTLKIIVLIIGIFIGYAFAHSRIAVAPTLGGAASTTRAASEKQIPDVKQFNLKVIDRVFTEGSGDITVHEGDVVSMTITVNEDEELHVHGYDKAVDLTKDTPSTLTFIANISGRFPFELEHSKTELGAFSVLPK